MSKMACLCGGVISDVVCPCPTEGWILRDQDQDDFYSLTARDIAAFFAAVQGGTRNAWIAKFFWPQFPTDVSDEVIVYDILAFHKREVVLSIAECAQCGRLWVQRGPRINAFRSYAPDEPGYVGVLRSQPAEGTKGGDERGGTRGDASNFTIAPPVFDEVTHDAGSGDACETGDFP